MFDTVLVANRGEIAVRVIRTLRAHGHPLGRRVQRRRRRRPARRGWPTSPCRIGPAPAAQSYLSIERGARRGRAHRRAGDPPRLRLPVRERRRSPAPARRPASSSSARRSPRSRRWATRSAPSRPSRRPGVPVVPGPHRAGHDRRRRSPPPPSTSASRCCSSRARRRRQGHARGRRAEDELADAIAGARREARGSFGDDTLLVERLRRQPAAHRGAGARPTRTATSIHLGERECSLQRRHQKVIEEAPSPLLDAADAGARWARRRSRRPQAVGYTGAGTVEFIVDGDRPRRRSSSWR